jgi:hypothetical protein
MEVFMLAIHLLLYQFEQFARTVGDAAVEQQRQMRQSFVAFANLISSAAQQEKAKWPSFRIPNYEIHAGQFRLQSGAEFVGCSYFVASEDEEEYLTFVTQNYEDSIQEGHLTLYGNLDRLKPFGYTRNFTMLGPYGFKPDLSSRSIRAPTWQSSPRKYIHYFTSLLLDGIPILCKV